jgi:hypothetical protein
MGLKKVRQARGPEDSVWYDDDGLMKMKIKVSAKTEGRLTALAIAAGNISLKLSHISAIAFILLNNKAAMPTSTFESTSSEIPLRIVVSFANDPAASLGASLTNYDWVRFKFFEGLSQNDFTMFYYLIIFIMVILPKGRRS